MNIAVINGSPKGDKSVTLQYIKHIKKVFPDHEFKVFHVGKKIKGLLKNRESFTAIVKEIETAAAVFWSFGVYFELIPYQLKRFIELIFESKSEYVFKGKYAVSVSTSAHWLDNCAHNYMHAICDDLDMKYCGYYSEEPDDLLDQEKRMRLVLFADTFFTFIKEQRPYQKEYLRVSRSDFCYVPEKDDQEKINQADKRLVVVSDCPEENGNLRKMINKFKACFSKKPEEINLGKMEIKGGCLACLNCAYDNHCVYEQKDEYNDILNNRIKTADIIVFAVPVKDRYFSARFKLFLDRSFVYGHIPIFRGKQVGFIVSGPLGQVQTIREPITGGLDWQRVNLVDFITDECADSRQIDSLLYELARRLYSYSKLNYIKSPTFYYKGISKIIRDDLWHYMRSMMKAEHKYYKKNRLYDFPKMNLQFRILSVLYNMKWFRKRVHKNRMLDDILIKDHQKINEDR